MGQEAGGPLNGPNNEQALFTTPDMVCNTRVRVNELFALLLFFSFFRTHCVYYNTSGVWTNIYGARAERWLSAKRQQAHQHLLIRILQTAGDTLVLCTLSAALYKAARIRRLFMLSKKSETPCGSLICECETSSVNATQPHTCRKVQLSCVAVPAG